MRPSIRPCRPPTHCAYHPAAVRLKEPAAGLHHPTAGRAGNRTGRELDEQVSQFLVSLVQALPTELGFLISKGGITSNDVLSQGLALSTTRVLGQIRAGCSVVQCPDDHPRYPRLPLVIFPGDVGGEEALTEVFRTLSRSPGGHDAEAAA